MNLKNTKIAFIGAGNMATALIKGLVANGAPSNNIWVSATTPEKLARLQDETGVNTSLENITVVSQADVVILAVKPQVMASVLEPLQDTLAQHKCLLISIAAGISLQSLQQWSSNTQAIVRCMPNTPSLVQAGASALYANSTTSSEQKKIAETILAAVGSVSWLDDEQAIDAVTALSGSGPAYFFLLMEAMQESAIGLGLSPENAQQLCLQTAFGAAKLALASDVDVAELRRRVTSPGGTTEAALNQFEADGFKRIVNNALEKAASRSKELTEILGNTK